MRSNYLFGYVHAKSRTFAEVHNKLLELGEKLKGLNKWNDDLYSRIPPMILGDVKIYPEGKLPFMRRVIYYTDHVEGSSHTGFPDQGSSDYYMSLRDEELPLFVNKDLPNIHKSIIEDRLKGEIKEIPIRQDLVNEKEKLSRRYRLLHNVIHGYKKLLTEYVQREINKNKRMYDPTELAVLDIDGVLYYFSGTPNSYNVKPLSSIKFLKVDPNEYTVR